MRLICVRTKAEYFSNPGLTLFLKIRSDLPVVRVDRARAGMRKANQSAEIAGRPMNPRRKARENLRASSPKLIQLVMPEYGEQQNDRQRNADQPE
jgi:hypothetical protein